MKRLFIFLSIIMFLGIANKTDASFWIGGGSGNNTDLHLGLGHIPFGQGATQTVGTDSNLFWDNTNKRLGIGTTNPSAILNIGDFRQERGQRINLSGRNLAWQIASYPKAANYSSNSESFIINLYDTSHYGIIAYETVLIDKVGNLYLANSGGKLYEGYLNYVSIKTYDDGVNINVYVFALMYCDLYTLDFVYNRLNTSLNPVIVGTDTYVPTGTLIGDTATAPYYVNVGNDSRLTILSNGYVGINTISPNSELNVKGALNLSGVTSGYVGLKAPATASSITYTLPSTDGSLGQVLSTSGIGSLSWINKDTDNLRKSYVQFNLNGGDEVLMVGDKIWLQVPYSGTITAVKVTSIETGSITISFKKSNFTNYPVFTSIVGTNPIIITSLNKYNKIDLSGWTTSITEGDYIYLTIDSVNLIKKINISIEIQKF